ncbi:MAG: helix-turn-helix domain-containing protein [Eubacterium sp.]|nr:helix-turn-helix domain-containing protein [Eubacterium sp.]
MISKNEPSFNVLDRITELRKLNNLSTYKLSRLSEIPQSTISTWYQKNYYPPIDKLESICRVFGISLSEFFYKKDDNVDIVTAEDKIHLEQWHRLSVYQKELVASLIKEMQ